MLTRRNRRFALGALVCTSISAFGLCLLGLGWIQPAQAQAPQPDDIPQTVLASLDPRWLQAIRGEAPKPGFAPQQAQSPQTLNVLLSDNTVAGRANNASPVLIHQLREDLLIASAFVSPVPDGSSFFYATQLQSYSLAGVPIPCYVGNNCLTRFASGDVIQVSQSGNVLTMTVPWMTTLAYPTEDAIRGVASPSETVSVTWFSATDANLSVTRPATVTADGDFEVSLTGLADVRPRDTGFAALATGPNTTAYQRFVAPFLRAQLDSPYITGYAAPYAFVNIQVRDVLGITRTTYADANGAGEFVGAVYSGTPYALAPGDVISASGAQSFSMTVEPITARASYTQSWVSGTAPANRPVSLAVLRGPVSANTSALPIFGPATHAVTSTTAGTFSLAAALQPGDYGTAAVEDADGNQSMVRFALPYLRARMGEAVFTWASASDLSALTGQLYPYRWPVTLTLQGKSGYLKDIRNASVYGEWGYFNASIYYGGSNNDGALNLLDAGDGVTVASGLGDAMTLTLPKLTAHINPSSDVVTGTAPPNSRVRVKVGYSYAYPYPVPSYPIPSPVPNATSVATSIPPSGVRKAELTATPIPVVPIAASSAIVMLAVNADASGAYTVSFAGLADLTNQSVGEVEWISPQGYAAVQTFRAQNYCAPRLTEVNLTRNTLNVEQLYNCPRFTLRLLGANGAEKAVVSFINTAFGLYLPQQILPNDIIELSMDGRAEQWRMPSVSVSLDPVTNFVSGTAPPNSSIQAWVVNAPVFSVVGYAGSNASFTTTVGANGAFTKSLQGDGVLNGPFDIAPGTAIRLTVEGAPNIVIESALLWARAHLYQSVLDVVTPSRDPISVTLHAPDVPPQVTSLVPGGYFFPYDRAIVPEQIRPGDQIQIGSGQQVISFSVPALSAKLDVAKRTVTGRAPPNARLSVRLSDYGGYGFPSFQLMLSQEVTATANGAFTATFTGSQVIPPYGSLVYMAPNGNEVALAFGTARWNITVGNVGVNGRASLTNFPATLVLRDANGVLKSEVTPYVDLSSGTFSGVFTVPVAGGDRIALAQPNNALVFAVPIFTAAHDAGRQVVEGQTMPNALVVFSLPQQPGVSGYGFAPRRTRANAAGRFALDTNGIALLLNGYATATLDDGLGNIINLNFVISGHKRYVPVVFR